jgi:hypothetical protein
MITFARVVLDSLADRTLARLDLRVPHADLRVHRATMAVPGAVPSIAQFLALKELTSSILAGDDHPDRRRHRRYFPHAPVLLASAAWARRGGAHGRASTWQIYWRIVLPTVRAARITLTIISFQRSWNEFRLCCKNTWSAGGWVAP